MEIRGLESQTGFRSSRETFDGLFSVSMALHTRRKHDKESWVLFLDLIRAFDSVPYKAVFDVPHRFGIPDHFCQSRHQAP